MTDDEEAVLIRALTERTEQLHMVRAELATARAELERIARELRAIRDEAAGDV